jgi:hypothetical protein
MNSVIQKAEVLGTFVKWNNYEKKYHITFKVKCPYCRSICRHGAGLHDSPDITVIKGVRPCDWCSPYTEYLVDY